MHFMLLHECSGSVTSGFSDSIHMSILIIYLTTKVHNNPKNVVYYQVHYGLVLRFNIMRDRLRKGTAPTWVNTK